MTKKSLFLLCMLLALALVLGGCSLTGDVPAAQAAGPEPADWMTLDMGWVPNQRYDGVQIMEIRRHDEHRLEIAHVPVIGLESLDNRLADWARAQMDAFERQSAEAEAPMRFMLECAVTQREDGLFSVIFAQQDSLRHAQNGAPLVSAMSFDKATGEAADPLSGYELSGELESRLGQLLRSSLVSGGAIPEDETWLTEALQGEGVAWDTAIAQDNGAALILTDPAGQAMAAAFTQEQVADARKSLKTAMDPGDGTKLVALTFDDGPAANTTAQLLDILKQYNVKVTFFVQGRQVTERPEVVARAYQEGHEIGNHTWSHKNLTKISMDEVNQQINDAADAVERACGFRPKLLRPPYGATTYSLRDQLTVPVIKWSVEPADSYTDSSSQIVQTILNDTRDGDIILLHDTHDYSVAAVPQVIEGLREKGFTFVTVTELLTRNGDTLQGGEAYRYCRPAN